MLHHHRRTVRRGILMPAFAAVLAMAGAAGAHPLNMLIFVEHLCIAFVVAEERQCYLAADDRWEERMCWVNSLAGQMECQSLAAE